MRKQAGAILRLARYREYVFFVVITTFLGAAAGQGVFGWRLIGVLAANWLAVAYAFMINDVEDAPDDALNPAKAHRNPVSAGDLSAKTARNASFGVAALALAAYALLGPWPFAIGAACLVLGHLYSWRAVRLKTRPVLDLISHCLMLAGLQFLAAAFAFMAHPEPGWAVPFALIVAISLYGELYNELRDLEGDRLAGVSHTAIWLGPRLSYWLMMGFLAIGLCSAAYTIVASGLMPGWALLTLGLLEAVFLARPFWGWLSAQDYARPRAWRQGRLRSGLGIQNQPGIDMHAPFHVPVQTAGAIAMLIWFMAPWLNALLRL